MSGKLYVIEGKDGSGKRTQSQMLYERLTNRGDDVLLVSFPDYELPSAQIINRYLRGEITTDDPYAISTIYAVNRLESYQTWKDRYEQGATIILDRYTTSNILYQGRDMLNVRNGKVTKNSKVFLERYLTWLFDLEYNCMGLPLPDVVFFLDIEADKVIERIHERSKNENRLIDVLEQKSVQVKVDVIAKYMQQNYYWVPIQCMEGDKQRSIQEIHEELWMYMLV